MRRVRGGNVRGWSFGKWLRVEITRLETKAQATHAAHEEADRLTVELASSRTLVEALSLSVNRLHQELMHSCSQLGLRTLLSTAPGTIIAS